MGQVLHYSLLLKDKTINFLMRLIGGLAFITLVFSILNTRTNFFVWYYLNHHNTMKALQDIIFPALPYLFFWLLLTVSGIKKWKKFLFFVPIISWLILPNYSYYIMKYHTNMGSFYYSSQITAFLGSIVLILGNFVLLLYCLNKYGGKISSLCQQAKKSFYKFYSRALGKNV